MHGTYRLELVRVLPQLRLQLATFTYCTIFCMHDHVGALLSSTPIVIALCVADGQSRKHRGFADSLHSD